MINIKNWSDKVVAEVVRMLLEAYYEHQFYDRSHGFSPGRFCHTALNDMLEVWKSILLFFQAEDGIRDFHMTGVQTCALPISSTPARFPNTHRSFLALLNLPK